MVSVLVYSRRRGEKKSEKKKRATERKRERKRETQRKRESSHALLIQNIPPHHCGDKKF